MRAMTLPFDPLFTSHCPSCMSLDTEYRPAERWGKCNAGGCGFRWRFEPYSVPIPLVPGIDIPGPARLPHEGER